MNFFKQARIGSWENYYRGVIRIIIAQSFVPHQSIKKVTLYKEQKTYY